MGLRSVDLNVTDRAILVMYSCLVMETGNTRCDAFKYRAVTFDTKLSHLAPLKHFWIRRTVCVMASSTTLSSYRQMFKHEGAFFVRMAFEAGRITADREPGIFLFKVTVRVMAVAAFHLALEDLVMKWLAKLRLSLIMAGHAELRFTLL